MKKKNKLSGVIYSTNPNFKFEYEDDIEKTISKAKQNLEVCIDKHRAGKTVVIIKGFVGNSNNLNCLSRMLKTKCGVGGSAKNGEIIIQGDIRNKVMEILEKEGYNYKRIGG
jgi:translation initiation factor 1